MLEKGRHFLSIAVYWIVSFLGEGGVSASKADKPYRDTMAMFKTVQYRT